MSRPRKLSPARRSALVAELLAGFDAAVTHPLQDPSLLSLFMDRVIGFQWSGWSNAAQRAVLLSFAENAPDADLEEMVTAARASRERLADYALECEYEDTTGESPWGDGFETWKRTRGAQAVAS